MIIKKCIECNKKYGIYPYLKTSKYCSKICCGRSHRSKDVISCKNCGIKFHRSPSKKAKYCSKKCVLKWGKQKILICAYCNLRYEKLESNSGRGKNNFCSIPCRILFYKKKVNLKCPICNGVFCGFTRRKVCSVECGNEKRRKPATKFKCFECGEFFKVKRFNKKESRRYCSKRCQAKTMNRERRMFGVTSSHSVAVRRAIAGASYHSKKCTGYPLRLQNKSIRNFIFAVQLTKQKIKGEKIPCLN